MVDTITHSITQAGQSDRTDTKVLIFSQFADTVRYLERRLKGAGVKAMAAVTGETSDPTGVAWRFSPGSNNKRDKIKADDEIRVLIATDVLSEGQKPRPMPRSGAAR